MEKTPDKIISEIVEIYKTQIKIPKIKPHKQFFLCPVGLIGSGKTTVLNLLSERLSLVKISGDEIRKILKEKGYGYDLTWRTGQALVQEFASKGYSIANDTDCATLRTQEHLQGLALEVGAQLVWIHINTPEEVILERMKSPRKIWLFKDSASEIENYKARKPRHENLDMNFIYTFDTSKDNLDEQINEAVSVILKSISSNAGQ